MKRRIVIEYDVLERTVRVAENDMTTFETFGVLEAAKMMVAGRWLSDEDSDIRE